MLKHFENHSTSRDVSDYYSFRKLQGQSVDLNMHKEGRHMGFPWWFSGKESACNAETTGDMGSIPGLGTIPWRRAWPPAPVFLPRESHGQRSLAGYIQSIAIQRVG